MTNTTPSANPSTAAVTDEEQVAIAQSIALSCEAAFRTDIPEEPAYSAIVEPAADTVTDVIDDVDHGGAVEPEEPAPVAEEEPLITRKQQNIRITFPVTSPGVAEDPDADGLVLPSNFVDETRAVLDNQPNVNLMNDPKTRDWATALSQGVELTTFGEGFIKTLEDPEAEFSQGVDFNGTTLAGARPKFKPAENQNLKGERASIRLMAHLGLGGLFQAPLWHSGFWITFKAPTESEIIELNRIMVADKIEFGRYTYGLAFTNTSAYTTDRLVDFALAHLYDTTLKLDNIPEGGLKSLIDCQDYPSLIWGFVCTMYPRGFNLSRACINDPKTCNHVEHETLNVSKMQFVNSAALTDWQKTHMSIRRANSKDLASITHYKEELKKRQNRRIAFNEGKSEELFITLKTPSLAQYVDAGHRWIGEIVDLVDKTLGMEAREVERNNFITRHGQASSMRQYVHWVDNLELESNVVDDRETIEGLFNIMSADNTVRNAFTEAVVNYIDTSSVAVIGIPLFDCPKCGMTQKSEASTPQHKNVIPMDMHQLFFGLLTQRLEKIATR